MACRVAQEEVLGRVEELGKVDMAIIFDRNICVSLSAMQPTRYVTSHLELSYPTSVTYYHSLKSLIIAIVID
jgi:hypothetical protein